MTLGVLPPFAQRGVPSSPRPAPKPDAQMRPSGPARFEKVRGLSEEEYRGRLFLERSSAEGSVFCLELQRTQSPLQQIDEANPATRTRGVVAHEGEREPRFGQLLLRVVQRTGGPDLRMVRERSVGVLPA